MSLKFTTPESGLNTMTRCVQNMKSGGSGCKLTDVSVEYTENGEYEVEIPDGFDGFSSVDVSVDVHPELETLNVTENGTYTPEKDGFSEVTVSITTPTEVWTAPSGTCFERSTFTQLNNVDFKNVSSFKYMFDHPDYVQALNVNCLNAKPTDMTRAFYGRGNLTFTGLDSSRCINMDSCFAIPNIGSEFNANITGLASLVTDSVTSMKYLFESRHYHSQGLLDDIANWNVSKVKAFNGAFSGVGSKQSEPLTFNYNWNTASATSFTNMFYASHFSYIQAFDATNATATDIFGSAYGNSCKNCTYFGGLKNCKIGYCINNLTLLTRESLIAIIDGLYDYLGTGIVPSTTPTMTIGETNLAKLTEDDIAEATLKGWTLV